MKFMLAIIVILSPTPLDAKPKTIPCRVTSITQVITLKCGKTILDIPEGEWPEKWAGKRRVGSVFYVSQHDGHLTPIATDEWRVRNMTREQIDYQRRPVN